MPITVREAAMLLGVTPGRVRQLISDGVIKADMIGTNYFINMVEYHKARRRNKKRGRPIRKGKRA